MPSQASLQDAIKLGWVTPPVELAGYCRESLTRLGFIPSSAPGTSVAVGAASGPTLREQGVHS